MHNLFTRIIVTETGCWEFDGSRHRLGYGLVQFDGKSRKAHRVAMHLSRGFDLSSKLMVLHKCDNRPCINPEHLYIGTQLDNMRDASMRGRFPDRRGLNNQNATKLTPARVFAIREMLASGISQQKIADHFNVPQTMISKIKLGQRWASV